MGTNAQPSGNAISLKFEVLDDSNEAVIGLRVDRARTPDDASVSLPAPVPFVINKKAITEDPKSPQPVRPSTPSSTQPGGQPAGQPATTQPTPPPTTPPPDANANANATPAPPSAQARKAITGAAPPIAAAWANPYSDVVELDWFYGAARFATERGLMKGTGKDKFSPGATMSRAMLVTVLYRMEGAPGVSGNIPFSDVNSGEWYSDAILWASQNGIANGYSNAEYGLDDPVTREQAVAILYRYAKWSGLDISAAANLSNYADIAGISNWALGAMEWAVSVGAIQGRTATTIVPDGTLTRAEAAMILKRYIENVVG
jgi:hypothetical protein